MDRFIPPDKHTCPVDYAGENPQQLPELSPDFFWTCPGQPPKHANFDPNKDS
jgi:hypothetical protein